MKLTKYFCLLLIGMISIVAVSCSNETEQDLKTVDTAVFAKEVQDPIADKLQPGDTLPEETISFKLAEIMKGKVEADSTFIGVTYENESYGKGNIVCRNRNSSFLADVGGSYGQASGCLYSNGVLYSFTWTEAHYETFADGINIRWVPAKSVYTVNSNCSCK